MKAVDYQSYIRPSYPVCYLRSQIERLHATPGLAQELESQTDAESVGDVRQFFEHPARFDYTILACCSMGQQARHDDYVRAVDLRGQTAYIFTFAQQFVVPALVSKSYSLD